MDEAPSSGQGALTVFVAVVFGVSLIGFLSGTHQDDYDFKTPVNSAKTAPDDAHYPSAASYAEMRRSPQGNTGFADDIATLRGGLPTRDQAADLDGTDKGIDLAARAARRAYDGAPPVIPHPVQQASASECAACHAEGIRLGHKTAPQFPHANFQVCVQCHAMAEPNAPWGDQSAGLADDPRAVPNSFAGLPAPERGPRWTGIAPPQIPHKTFMHERCESCHGVTGKNALRSTHPDRQNCEQCHAPQAAIEWRPGGHR